MQSCGQPGDIYGLAVHNLLTMRAPCRAGAPRVQRGQYFATTTTGAGATSMDPQTYLERVYAGVLGKIIGVYVGRPFEGWSHERILSELGEIKYYVHEQAGQAAGGDRRRHLGHLCLSAGHARLWQHPGPHRRADRPDLAELSDRKPDDPVVGRHGQLHRAHRLSAPGAGAARAGERQPSPPMARWWPSRSARRSSSTAGA